MLRLPLWTLLCGYVLLGCSAVQPPLNAALTDRTPPEERAAWLGSGLGLEVRVRVRVS